MKLARESFKLLRALAGNDKVKASVIQHGAAPIINDVLNKHKVTLNNRYFMIQSVLLEGHFSK